MLTERRIRVGLDTREILKRFKISVTVRLVWLKDRTNPNCFHSGSASGCSTESRKRISSRSEKGLPEVFCGSLYSTEYWMRLRLGRARMLITSPVVDCNSIRAISPLWRLQSGSYSPAHKQCWLSLGSVNVKLVKRIVIVWNWLFLCLKSLAT
jgi:hypothetical protein